MTSTEAPKACSVQGGWKRHGCEGCVKLYGAFIAVHEVRISIND